MTTEPAATNTEPGYEQYRYLSFARPHDGVLEIHIERPDRLNATDVQLHHELTQVWLDIENDDATAAVLVTGRGRAFSAGGDFAMLEGNVEDWDRRVRSWRQTIRLVQNLVNFAKPLVSAINGPAVGAGLAVALLADVPISARSARLIDGHARLGVAAGDHAVLLWPLLCGLAKAKYHLLTGEPISGDEAERMGLVALTVDDDELLVKARQVTARLAESPPAATQWTKHALNNWLRMAWPVFDSSAALEFLSFSGPEAREGLDSLVQKRSPNFDRQPPVA